MSITTTGVVTNGVVVPNTPLPEGARVEVIVVPAESGERQYISVLDFLESLPTGPRAFKTWDEYEAFLEAEKDSWER